MVTIASRARRRALLAAALALAACSRSDPEKELRETIAEMADAVERRDLGAFLDALADDFTRESGAFGKQDVKRILAALVLRHAKISVIVAVTDVRIEGQRAFARARVVATGGAGLLPEQGQTWEFESAWRRDGDRWRVFNAEWRSGL